MIPPTAVADPAPDARTVSALERAFTSARQLPAWSIAGVRAGTLHTATVDGTTWAIAAFTPAAADSAELRARFQDGAATGVFTATPGKPWRLLRTGPYGCSPELPAAVRAAWRLPQSVDCLASPAAQEQAARTAQTHTGPPRSLVQRIVRIALSKVGTGVNPPSNRFSLDCNPYTTMVGASSANTIGCGFDGGFGVQNQNEPWCSDFTKWVWQQAGVTADMGIINAGASSFYAWGLKHNSAGPVNGGKPAVGDAVVFFPAGPLNPNGFADHVGTITAVHPNGTVDMVNGDFQGATAIATQYDLNLNLATWPGTNWGPGEQYVLITPPGERQQPAPVTRLDAPRVAVAGQSLAMRADSDARGGTITQYAWTFGDGRTSNTTGASVSHAYANAGVYPVTVTAASSLGTVTIRTTTVTVSGASSALSAAPDNAVWYLTTPVIQDLFLPPVAFGIPPFGVLRSRRWDGTRWLPLIVPGRATPDAPVTALTFPDPTVSYVMAQHAYYRADTGALAQTYATDAPTSANADSAATPGWATQQLPGLPAPDSAIAAATAPDPGLPHVAPLVYFFDEAGALHETARHGGAWRDRVVPVGGSGDRGTLSVAVTPAGVRVFFLDRRGLPSVATKTGGGWRVSAIPAPHGVAPGSPLSAISTGDGRSALFFMDRRGLLNQAATVGYGWSVHDVPTAPGLLAGPDSMVATTVRLPSGATGVAVAYRTATGPALTSWDGRNWQVEPLPGPADAILGASSYTAIGEPQRVFLRNTGIVSVAERPAPTGPWTTTVLPAIP